MAETLAFKTELKQLLHLIVHSLYSHPDIFLRELVSNASDAIDTVRFQSLTQSELIEDNGDWKIKLIPDKEKQTLTIADNGIGMSHETVVENLGTIARSGTKAFLEALKAANSEKRPELIGQFGVGFYSAFMVADKVTVITRMAGQPAVRWESDGQGEYTIEASDRSTRVARRPSFILKSGREGLSSNRSSCIGIILKYSDFVEFPIVLDGSRRRIPKEEVDRRGDAQQPQGGGSCGARTRSRKRNTLSSTSTCRTITSRRSRRSTTRLRGTSSSRRFSTSRPIGRWT